MPHVPGAKAEIPEDLMVLPPQGMDRKAAKDWQKLVEALQDHEFAKARDRLDEWEHKYGEVNESASVRTWLDRLPPDQLERGGRPSED
jgi:hypothetical protein